MRSSLLTLVLILGACGNTVTTDAGGRTDAGPPPCEEPSIRVLLRTDYVAGDEVVSVIIEQNDMVVGGLGVTTADDLSGDFEVGRVCDVRPRSRILIRLRDPAGIELGVSQVIVDDPATTPEVVIMISR